VAKRTKKSTRRIKNLALICTLSSFVFIVATYAWFIGMRTVNVNSYDVEIAVTDSLLLSLDGKKWDTSVNINGTNFNDDKVVYSGNTNSWSKGGLIPVSSVGQMDSGASRMILYEKGSLTTTEGGYRLMASRVVNDADAAGEAKGYVAFDLFVKNFSGTEYYTENKVANEEAIYLTTDSEVKIAGDGVQDTGIENSVRVAFAQVGRVSAKTTDPSVITGITCDTKNSVTGICRTAQIWEPNEKDHVDGAISNYNASCGKRNAKDGDGKELKDVFATGAYGTKGTCGEIKDDTAYPTYAIRREITETSLVDVYDGKEFNGYETNTYSETNATAPLDKYDTFTNEEKDLVGNQRPTFITLAPNSITKVRVYIYIEGQDIDNYDMASIGKKISIAFGFTKDRYDFDDSESYKDNVVAGDTVDPEFAIATDYASTITKPEGEDDYTYTVAKGTTIDPKALVTASDHKTETTDDDANTDKAVDITSRIDVVNNTVKSDTPGTYLISYVVSDWAGNYTQFDIKVVVSDS